VQQWSRAQRRWRRRSTLAGLDDLRRRWDDPDVGLLPFDEASRRLGAASRSYRGIQEIPVERIVGSVNRTDDFDRDFRPRRELSRARLQQLRDAAADGGLPAISVFEVGGAYFVEDGHHRVALARQQGADFIDAQVTSLLTDYEIGPDVDVCQLLHTEQQRQTLEATGLSVARPDAVIQFTLLEGYPELRELIDAYGYAWCRDHGELRPQAEIAASWHDTVYRPGLEAVRRADLPRRAASWHSTEADLVLWVYQIRRELRAHDPEVTFDQAAHHARGVNLGYLRKRHHLRDGSAPLPRRLP
jgi:hypothetical protein